jgi:hypothetical protein
MTDALVLCCYCLEPFDIAGRDGLIWHILTDHPDSAVAAKIRVHLGYLQTEVMA